MVSRKEIMDELVEQILTDIEYLDQSILEALHQVDKMSDGLDHLIQEI